MDIYDTIVRPIVTEKSTHQAGFHSQARGGAYSFEVHPEANKAQVRDAVEKIYRVKVLSVNTSIRRGKRTRFRLHWGQQRSTKRAVVFVHPDSAIDLF